MNPTLLEFLGSLAFGAGGAYFLIKQSRKDVNGLGSKVNAEVRKSATRHQNVTLALMLIASGDEEKAKRVADMLKENE
jgi:hypothetical protein